MIQNKVVAITGASSGIGEATALHLASLGAKVVLGARRTDRLEQLGRAIRERGGAAVWRPLDVAQRTRVDEFTRFALDEYGRLDVLVNNAGLMPLSRMDALKVSEWERMVDVNIKGVLYGIAAVLPLMKTQGSGHIINVSSIAGRYVYATAAVYCATKFAVHAISEGLRQEVGSQIRVTTIAPGATESELASTISDNETRRTVEEVFRKDTLPAEAIARAIAYAVDQPHDVDVNEIVIRPTAQAY